MQTVATMNGIIRKTSGRILLCEPFTTTETIEHLKITTVPGNVQMLV